MLSVALAEGFRSACGTVCLCVRVKTFTKSLHTSYISSTDRSSTDRSSTDRSSTYGSSRSSTYGSSRSSAEDPLLPLGSVLQDVHTRIADPTYEACAKSCRLDDPTREHELQLIDHAHQESSYLP